MTYTLAKCNGDSTNVPQMIFARLSEVKGEYIKVALYVVATNDTDPADVARAVNIKKSDAQRALDYWAGAGLLVARGNTGSIDDAPPRRAAHLTSREVAGIAMTDPAIAFLVQESQRAFGRVLTQSETNTLVSLYINDGLPVDMILMGGAHYGKGMNKRASYVETRLLSLADEGITTGEAMEKHLQHEVDCAAMEARAADILGVKPESLTHAERRSIDVWYEGFGFSDDMVREAVGYAGEKKSVKYVNGILRSWYGKGWKTVRDVLDAGAVQMQNLQATGAESARPDLMQNDLAQTPVFKKRGTKA